MFKHYLWTTFRMCNCSLYSYVCLPVPVCLCIIPVFLFTNNFHSIIIISASICIARLFVVNEDCSGYEYTPYEVVTDTLYILLLPLSSTLSVKLLSHI